MAPVASAPASVPMSFRLLLAGCTALCVYLVQPFLRPLFFAGVLALAAWPAHRRLSQRLGGRPHLVAALLTLALLGLLVAPVASSVAFAVGELTSGLTWLRDALGVESLSTLSWDRTPEALQPLLDKLVNALHIGQVDLERYTGQVLQYVQQTAPTMLTASFNAAADALVVTIAFYFLIVDGHKIVEFVGRVSPLQPEQTAELLTGIRDVSSAALMGTALTSLLQGVLFCVGFALTHIPHAVFFGMITVVAGFVPVVGAALVAGPAVVGLALTGHMGGAIALAIWCILVTVVADHVVKPMLLRGRVAMHTGLVLLALLGGITGFGLSGIVAGPLVMASFMSAWRIYERDFVAPKAAAARAAALKPEPVAPG